MPGEITKLLGLEGGHADAGEEVIAMTYGELRRVAHAYLRRERRAHTLQTTAILHDAYIRLLRKGPGSVDTREAFFRLMAAEKRRRLVDHARRRLAGKRGVGAVHEPVDASIPARRPMGPRTSKRHCAGSIARSRISVRPILGRRRSCSSGSLRA